MLAHPKGPWVDWSWEESLDFRDSQCVAFFSNVDVTQVCGKFVRSQSVHLGLFFIGWTQLAPFSRPDTGFDSFGTGLAP